jgi:hypothetical protein
MQNVSPVRLVLAVSLPVAELVEHSRAAVARLVLNMDRADFGEQLFASSRSDGVDRRHA